VLDDKGQEVAHGLSLDAGPSRACGPDADSVNFASDLPRPLETHPDDQLDEVTTHSPGVASGGEPAVEIEGGADERQVSERLGEVAQVLRLRA
jgi:hypothetical protein